jgi:AcrR family transcriptional regulator
MGTKPKTRDRILQTALQLFNEEGETLVSTVDIASTMGISPGNLYYHFKGKEAIIEGLFDNFEEEISLILNAPIRGPLAVEDNWVFVYIIFEEIYDFRFFYQNISAMLERCPGLRPRFSRILSLIQKTGFAMLSVLEEKDLLSFGPDEKEALSERLTAHLTFWLQYYSLRYTDMNEKHLIHYGVYEALIQVTPYLSNPASTFPQTLAAFLSDQIENS